MVLNTGKTCVLIISLYAAVWVKVYFYPWTTSVIAFLALPFALVVAIGIYAAFTVIKGVITFNRSQTALEDLKKDMKMAELALKRAGFDFAKYSIPTSS